MTAPSCAKCGACTTVCPVYQVTGRESLTARGKLHLLNRLAGTAPSRAYADIIAKCLLCGACRQACPQKMDLPALISAARQQPGRKTGRRAALNFLARQALSHAPLLSAVLAGGAALNLLAPYLPAQSGLRRQLAALDLKGLRPPAAGYIKSRRAAAGRRLAAEQNAGSYGYFSGCLANHVYPEIGVATEALLSGRLFGKERSAGPLVPEAQVCCGQAAWAAGDLEEARRLAQQNITAFEGSARPILTSCAACYHHMLAYPDLFVEDQAWHQKAVAFAGRLREFWSLFDEVVSQPASTCRATAPAATPATGVVNKRVFYHDPCHLRHDLQMTAAPRRLLARLPGLELVALPGGPQCCGHGGLFAVSHPELAGRICERLMKNFAPLGAEIVTTSCSGCFLQWRQALAAANNPARVMHPAVLLAERLGI